MKRLLVLVAVFLVTSAAAQDAIITSNRWASDALIVSGTLSNPNGWPVEFVGFDKDQKIVTRNNYYKNGSETREVLDRLRARFKATQRASHLAVAETTAGRDQRGAGMSAASHGSFQVDGIPENDGSDGQI